MRPKPGTVVLVNRGYGYKERVHLKYYVNTHWARGISLDFPGIWQHFDAMRCEPTDEQICSCSLGPKCYRSIEARKGGV